MITLVYNVFKPEQGGVGRYAYEFTRQLRKKIVFNEINLSSSFGRSKLEKIQAFLWKRKRTILDNGLSEINHFLQTEIYYPIGEGKDVVTFHSPPPFTKGGTYPTLNNIFRGVLYLNRYKDAVDNADVLIANGQLTKDGIVEMCGERKKIKIVLLGVSENFKIIRNWGRRKNIIGYVQSSAPHKRVEKLLCDWKNNKSKMNGYRLSSYSYGSVPEKEIVNVYNTFKAFVFPSKVESFGLPVIEAVASGTPVFVYEDSDITPEVKKYGIWIQSVSEIPAILEDIDIKIIERKAREVRKEFNWNKNVEDTLKIYKKLG